MLDPLKLADALDAEGELHLPEGGGKISAEAFAAIVRALRELGAKPDDPADGGVKDDLDVGRIAFHALRALRPGDVVPGGVVAPREPTEAMWGGLARDIIMWTRFPHQSGSALHAHLRNCSAAPVPAWLLAEIPDTDAVPPKGTVAACIYKAMLAAIQEPPHAD